MSYSFVSPANFEDHPHEVFIEPSMCDKTAFEPLTVTLDRMMQSGRVAGAARRAMYDYGSENIDMEKAQTMPVYPADMVDMQNIAKEAETNVQKLVDEAKAQNVTEDKANESV